MEPKRVDRILDEWDAVAKAAPRPATPPRRLRVQPGRAGATLAGASLVVVTLVVAVALLGRPGPGGSVGAVATTIPSTTAIPSATPSATPEPTPAVTPAPTVAPTASPVPTPTVTPTVGPCDVSKLPARIVLWEGAAGHRIAHVELTNAGASTCTVPDLARPQLVDGQGAVLIDGTQPTTPTKLTVAPGDVLKTLVQDANYCGPDPKAPVSVAFVMDGGRIVATPVSPTDTTVPPCNGSPGSAGDIEMQPLAP